MTQRGALSCLWTPDRRPGSQGLPPGEGHVPPACRPSGCTPPARTEQTGTRVPGLPVTGTGAALSSLLLSPALGPVRKRVSGRRLG